MAHREITFDASLQSWREDIAAPGSGGNGDWIVLPAGDRPVLLSIISGIGHFELTHEPRANVLAGSVTAGYADPAGDKTGPYTVRLPSAPTAVRAVGNCAVVIEIKRSP